MEVAMKRGPTEGYILARKECLISLSQAAGLFARKKPGKKIHTAVIARYMLRGLNGCILESVKTTAGRCTSVEAVRRFQRTLSRRRDAEQPVAPQDPVAPVDSYAHA